MEEEALTRSVTIMLRFGACYCISDKTSNLTTTTDFGSHYRWTLFCVVFYERQGELLGLLAENCWADNVVSITHRQPRQDSQPNCLHHLPVMMMSSSRVS